MSRRTERISSLVRSVIADALQRRLSDPRIEPLTSVTRVEVSDDLSIAHVHVSVMARDARRKLCVTALNAAAGRMRGMLGEALATRTVPELRFHLDDSLQRGFETVQLLDQIMHRDQPDAAETAADDEGEPPPDATIPTDSDDLDGRTGAR